MTAQKKREILTGGIAALLIVCAVAARVITRGRREAAYFLPVSLLRSMIYIGLMTWWGVSRWQRIVQTQVRRYLAATAALCVFWLSIRTVKFFFAVSPAAIRYLWYGYYFPMLFIPLLCVLVALSLGRPENYRLPKWTNLLYIPTALLLLLVLTNDLLVQDELRDTGDVLKAENAQKARRLKLEEQTKLYDLVERQSAPQFARLEALLSELSGAQSRKEAKPLLGRIAAICIFSSKGLVRLMNRRMLAVGAMLLGSGIQTLGELREALQDPPEGVAKDTSMPGVYHFPDGSALRFSENGIQDRDGQRYTEVIAADVSELMAVRAQLDAANEALRKLGEEMADIVREEEILNMKIRVHDDVGYSLLSVRRACWQCESMEALHTLAGQWRTTIRLLHAGAPGGTGAGDNGHSMPSALRADDQTSHTGGTDMTDILIVEDQPMVRKLLESYVEKEPEFMLAASIPGANLAPELCRQQPVDLILMDVQTENRENGLAAAAQIKIVIVTSLLDAEILRQAKRIGADSLWYKDGSQEKLMEIVRRTLAGEHIFPDAPPVTQIGTAKSSEFTEAEMRVLRCLVQGMSYTATAQTLGIDARTVKFHVSNMLQKTNFENKLQLAVAAIENRLTANFPDE